ncbi:MAG: nitroreductase family protein [Methanomicrobiales archaeon]|nr:nitroreductase family protein [Methanomicrobiales archaeon]
MDSSEFFSFIAGRSSVRDYPPQELDSGVLEFLLGCASTAPSAGNLEAWDAVAVQDRSIRLKLSDAALHQAHIAEAPLVLVVCANYPRSMSRYGERGRLYAIQDATIACTYMMLAAHALGLHTCWTGAFDEERVRGILGIPPEIGAVAMLPVGRGRQEPYRTGRMPVDRHLHMDRW